VASPRRANPPAASPGDLHDLAREKFLKGERLEIQTLAEELGISRATAYRWAVNAEQLAGQVLVSLMRENFDQSVRRARGWGAARVVDAMAIGMRTITRSRPYRIFLERDPQRALRIAASKDGPVQRQTIALHQALLEEEVAAGRLELPVDAHTMAYALVRIAETFLYADLIAGEEPDLDKAAEILKLMLRPPPAAPGA
jgi:hypothetical protein